MNLNINRVKIFVTVPPSNTDDIRDAVCNLGAGIIGEYKYCTACTKVIGTFIPSDNSKPYIGKNSELEVVEENKLEFVCDIKIAKKVVNEIRRVHPYEEPAIDIVPLIDENDLL